MEKLKRPKKSKREMLKKRENGRRAHPVLRVSGQRLGEFRRAKPTDNKRKAPAKKLSITNLVGESKKGGAGKHQKKKPWTRQA